MKVDLKAIRQRSLDRAKVLGYQVNDRLPLLDPNPAPRPLSEVTIRILCLDAVVTAAWAGGVQEVEAWLQREGLNKNLSEAERTFLESGHDAEAMKFRVEALWALLWSINATPDLDFAAMCSDKLASLVPNPIENESSKPYSKKWQLRGSRELVEQADLAYCLHWAIQDALIKRQRPPGKLHPLRVIERRRALEWLQGTDDWDHVALDT